MRALLEFLEPHSLLWMSFLPVAITAVRRRMRSLAVFAGVMWLLGALLLCTPLPDVLYASLERHWKRAELADVPQLDAVICLGGGAEGSQAEFSQIRLKNGNARLLSSIELLRAGKAKALVIGGGQTRLQSGPISESAAAKAWIERWNLVPAPVHALPICADTHDEALNSAVLIQQHKWQHIGLVTSASHMHRAAATFEKVGLRVLPLPCDYQSQIMRGIREPLLHVPDIQGLLFIKGWLHEQLGRLVYRWRGWM